MYMHMYTVHTHVYCTHTCILYTHMYTVHTHVYCTHTYAVVLFVAGVPTPPTGS